MCLEDIRIQRKTTSGEKSVLLEATPKPFIPASMDRTALIIDAPETEECVISMTPSPDANTGFRLQPGGNRLELSLMTHGDMVRKQFWGIALANTQWLTYWESSFVDDKQ